MASATTTSRVRGADRPSVASSARARLLARHPLRAGFGIYLGAALLLLLPVWLDPVGRWAGGSGDAEQATWFLAWTPHAIAHGWNPLTSTALNAPAGVNLAWDMLMPLPGLLLAPVTLTLGPLVSYNLLVTIGLALCGVSAQAAIRRHVASPIAALVGGALYAFGPFAAGQIAGHPNLIAAAALLPLVLIAVERIVAAEVSALRGGSWLGALAVADLLVWEEALATTALAGAVLLGVLATLRPESTRAAARRLGAALGIAAAVAAPVALPFLAQQFLGAGAVHGSIQARGYFVTDLLNPLIPTRTALVSPGALASVSDSFTGNVLENDAYLGLPLILISCWVARRWWADLTVRAATLTGVGLLVLSLGPSLHVAGHDTGIPLPWRLVQALPLAGEMLPSRLGQHVDLAAALLLAVFVDRAVVSGGPRARRAPALLALAAGVLLLPLLPYPTTPSSTPAFFTSASVHRIPEGSTALVLPYSHDPWSSSAMLWQAEAGMRFTMPEGYFIGPGDGGRALPGPRPTELSADLLTIESGGAAPRLDGATRTRLLGQLRAWGVSTVLVGPMSHADAEVAFVRDLLGLAPQTAGDVAVWWSVPS